MTSWTQQGVVVPAPQASRGCHHCLGANGGSEGLQDALEKCLLGPGVGGGLAAPFNQPRSLTGPRKKKKNRYPGGVQKALGTSPSNNDLGLVTGQV